MARMTAWIGLTLVIFTPGWTPPLAGSPPAAEDFEVVVAPGETVALPFSEHISDPDGDLFGVVLTSGLSDPAAGTLLSQCFCRILLGNGEICSCSATFTASDAFSGTTTLTYRAVDLTGLQSANATVTIRVGAPQSPEGVIEQLIHILTRARIGDLIPSGLATSLLSKTDAVTDARIHGRRQAATGLAGALVRETEAITLPSPLKEDLVALASLLQHLITEWICPPCFVFAHDIGIQGNNSFWLSDPPQGGYQVATNTLDLNLTGRVDFGGHPGDEVFIVAGIHFPNGALLTDVHGDWETAPGQTVGALPATVNDTVEATIVVVAAEVRTVPESCFSTFDLSHITVDIRGILRGIVEDSLPAPAPGAIAHIISGRIHTDGAVRLFVWTVCAPPAGLGTRADVEAFVSSIGSSAEGQLRFIHPAHRGQPGSFTFGPD